MPGAAYLKPNLTFCAFCNQSGQIGEIPYEAQA